MPLATLSIDLEAKLAKLEQGLNRAVQVSEQQAGRMQAAFSAAQGAAGVLGGAAAAAIAAATLVSKGQEAIAALDYLDDLAEKYGVAASALAQWQFAAEVAGTPTDALAKGLGKLSKAAAEGNDGLKAMGIATRGANGELKSTDQLLLEVANKFAGYRDDAAKAALAMAVFGKSGVDMIPLLNKGADGIEQLRTQAQKLGITFTDEAARQAGEFNDNLKRLELASKAFYVQIASNVLPALVQLSNEYLKAAERGDRLATLWEKFKPLFSGSLSFNAAFTGDPQRQADEATYALQRQQKAVEGLQQQLQAEPTNKLTQRLLSGAQAQLSVLEQSAVRAKLALDLAEGKLGKDGFDRGSRGVVETPAKKQAPGVDAEAIASTKRRDEAFQKFLQRLQQQRAVVQAELDIGGQLQESDKERLRLLGELSDKTHNFTGAQKQLGSVEAERLVKLIRNKEELQKSAKLTETLAAIEAQQVAMRRAEADALAKETEAVKQQLVEYGLTAEQLDQLRTKRLQEALATEIQTQSRLAASAASEAEISESQRKISLLVQQIDARRALNAAQQAERADGIGGMAKGLDDYLEAIKDAGVATRQVAAQAARGLEDDLVNSLKAGRLDVSRTIDYIIGEFLRLAVVQPLLKNLADSLGGGAGIVGGVAKLLGFANGGAFGAVAPMPFAAGGVFDSATLFKFANGGAMATGVLGEAGPEAVMPLMRGPGGKLGVRQYGNGGQAPVVVNMSLTFASGVSRQEMAAYGQIIKQQTIAAVADAQRRGRNLQGA